MERENVYVEIYHSNHNHVITRITGAETIKRQGYVWLYGCGSKSVSAGLSCGIGCTPALPVTHSTAAVCGLWRYMRAMPLPF